MADASLTQAGEGEARLSGVLDFSTVPGLWLELRGLIGEGSALDLSLSGVTSSNSAGLALLVEALQKASSGACKLRFQDVPQDLVDLAELSNLGGLLGLKPAS